MAVIKFFLKRLRIIFSNHALPATYFVHRKREVGGAATDSKNCGRHKNDDQLFKNESDDAKEKIHNNSQMGDLVARMKPSLEGRHPLNQSLYIETKTRLSGWILWKSDRLSMAHSVEARVPFIDHKLVELAAQIPPWLKLNGMDEKYILKKIMSEHMPEHPQQFKKRAFYTPIKEWFFTEEKILEIQSYISNASIDNVGIFSSKAVSKMTEEIIALAPPKTYDDYYSLMKLEWGLMVVLTVQILHWLFVEKNAPCFQRKH